MAIGEKKRPEQLPEKLVGWTLMLSQASANQIFWATPHKQLQCFSHAPFCSTTFMSDYDLRPGGSLKLKGGVAEGGIVKK